MSKEILFQGIKLFNGCEMFVNPNDPGISKDLKTKGIRELFATKYYQDILKPGMVVYDIGSNIGYYVLVTHEKIGQEGFIYAFEPLPINVEYLRKNVLLNNIDNIEVYQLALGDKWAEETLSVSKMSNLNAIVKEENLSELGFNWFKTHIVDKVDVIQWDLDNFIDQHDLPIPDVIRMDVEGYEIKILDGASSTLEAMGKGSILFVEIHGDLVKDKKNSVPKLYNDLSAKGFNPVWGHGMSPKGEDVFYKKLDIEGFIDFSINNNFTHIFFIKSD